MYGFKGDVKHEICFSVGYYLLDVEVAMFMMDNVCAL